MSREKKVSPLSTSSSGALFSADSGEEKKSEAQSSISPKKRVQPEIDRMGKYHSSRFH